ncbi:unnamed protein product [Paramecium pentaurelia]|uniref:Uncharacterized protein n=1 Tax=Paramecium pentaurelia TaxID=43138 RepID=A0A8S1YQ49_9CILI|nr:unnamed protein product [Paramecium pentaurelia]
MQAFNTISKKFESDILILGEMDQKLKDSHTILSYNKYYILRTSMQMRKKRKKTTSPLNIRDYFQLNWKNNESFQRIRKIHIMN